MRVELHVKSHLFEPCVETQSAAPYAVQTEDVNFNQRNLNDLNRPCQESAVHAINHTVPKRFEKTNRGKKKKTPDVFFSMHPQDVAPHLFVRKKNCVSAA